MLIRLERYGIIVSFVLVTFAALYLSPVFRGVNWHKSN